MLNLESVQKIPSDVTVFKHEIIIFCVAEGCQPLSSHTTIYVPQILAPAKKSALAAANDRIFTITFSEMQKKRVSHSVTVGFFFYCHYVMPRYRFHFLPYISRFLLDTMIPLVYQELRCEQKRRKRL